MTDVKLLLEECETALRTSAAKFREQRTSKGVKRAERHERLVAKIREYLTA